MALALGGFRVGAHSNEKTISTEHTADDMKDAERDYAVYL